MVLCDGFHTHIKFLVSLFVNFIQDKTTMVPIG